MHDLCLLLISVPVRHSYLEEGIRGHRDGSESGGRRRRWRPVITLSPSLCFPVNWEEGESI